MCASSDKSDNFIFYEDEFKGYSLSHFCMSHHYNEVLDSVLIPGGLIRDRIEKMAADITRHFDKAGAKSISTLCVLKGGFKFFADLIDGIERMNRTRDHIATVSIDFIKLSSYVDAKSTSVKVTGMDNLESLRDKDVLVVEDIIDTGKSIKRLVEYLAEFQPRSVRVASLLVKRTPLSCGYRPDFTGFEVPDRFLVGYALDYNDHFRDLSHICVINEEGRRRYATRP